MPTEKQHATAAPRAFRANGKEYFITPITQGEWGEYLAWVVDTWLDTQKRNAKDLEPADRQAVLLRAFESAGKMSLSSEECRSVTQTPAGLYRLVWMHLRNRHPNITPEEVASILDSEELMADAMAKVEQTTGNKPEPKKAKGRVKKPLAANTRLARRKQ